MAFAASMVAACARYGQNPPATPAQEQITPEQLTRSGLRFDVCFLATALRRDEKALQTMLQRTLFLTVLPYRSDRRDRLLAQQVRQALANPAVVPHTAQSLAAALNLSPRSLHRQLREEGVSLPQLKDGMRSDKARDLLLPTKPLEQVAAAGGFRNDKSFSRTFLRLTGVLPGGSAGK